MPSAASDEEQAGEQGAVLAEQEETGERDLSRMTHKARIEELFKPLMDRVSKLLEAGGPRRVTGDLQRRTLAFLKMELTGIFVSLRDNHDSLGRGEWRQWRQFVADTDRLLQRTEPGDWTLLLRRRATLCFRSREPDHTSWFYLKRIRLTDHPCRYSRRLHLPRSDLGLPHQPVSEGIPLVGMDRPAKKLLRWLVPPRGEKQRLRVMAIVGPAGMGKTTLAMELRKRLLDPSGGAAGGRYYFQYSVMARAPPPRTSWNDWADDRNELLLQDILSQVSDPAEPASSSDQSDPKTLKDSELLVRLVSERLQNKRYFVIIDGISEASDWEEISDAFPSINLGSRILITTRYRSTAWACCSVYGDDGHVHEMKPLNQMDSERLLLSKAFGSMYDGSPPDKVVKPLCEEILSRCEGIPLLITGMAEQFKQQLQQQQQEEVHQRNTIYEEGWLKQAMSHAYDGFTNGLKLSSLYMIMFPSGYNFEEDSIIRKWISEGLISFLAEEKRSFTLDTSDWKKGKWCVSQLIAMNVIISAAAAGCKHGLDEAETTSKWHVNHYMQEFLASKSAEIGFGFTSATLHLAATSAATEASRTPRRLALHHPRPDIPLLLGAMDLSETRSLAVSGAVSGIPLDRFVNLVVLDLQGWENLKDEDLLRLCRRKMFFLRYLSVRNTRVSKLPHEIKHMRILEAMDASHTHISELPLELFQLTHLHHLDLRGTLISQLPKQIVGLQPSLTALLVDLTDLPASSIRALGHLRLLRVVAVTWSFQQSTDTDCCEALTSSIDRWIRTQLRGVVAKDLESLTIHCGLGCSMEFLGTQLPNPPKSLKKLKVTCGRFASVPRWINGLRYLAFVQITLCKKGEDDLKILGGLPKLKCLILGLDFVPAGEAIVIESEGFQQLQRFSIDCPMPWLTFSQGAMWNLTFLQLKFCAIPASQPGVPSGISNLRRLTEVALCYDEHYVNSPSIKNTVEAVRGQVAEHLNPIDLFINGIEQDDVQVVDGMTENTTGTIPSRTGARVRDDSAQGVDKEATTTAQSEIAGIEQDGVQAVDELTQNATGTPCGTSAEAVDEEAQQLFKVRLLKLKIDPTLS